MKMYQTMKILSLFSLSVVLVSAVVKRDDHQPTLLRSGDAAAPSDNKKSQRELNDEYHREVSRQLFGGEDMFNGDPWWHEVLADEASLQEGFSTTAAERVAWHADYTDR